MFQNSTIIELVNELYNRIRDIEKENTSTCATSLSGTGGNCKSIAESARPTVLNGSSSSSSSASSSGNWSTTTSSSVNGGSSKGEQVEVVGGGTATRACNASTSNASNERNQVRLKLDSISYTCRWCHQGIITRLVKSSKSGIQQRDKKLTNNSWKSLTVNHTIEMIFVNNRTVHPIRLKLKNCVNWRSLSMRVNLLFNKISHNYIT